MNSVVGRSLFVVDALVVSFAGSLLTRSWVLVAGPRLCASDQRRTTSDGFLSASFPIMANSGMYREIMMPPMLTPRQPMMTGSSMPACLWWRIDFVFVEVAIFWSMIHGAGGFADADHLVTMLGKTPHSRKGSTMVRPSSMLCVPSSAPLRGLCCPSAGGDGQAFEYGNAGVMSVPSVRVNGRLRSFQQDAITGSLSSIASK